MVSDATPGRQSTVATMGCSLPDCDHREDLTFDGPATTERIRKAFIAHGWSLTLRKQSYTGVAIYQCPKHT